MYIDTFVCVCVFHLVCAYVNCYLLVKFRVRVGEGKCGKLTHETLKTVKKTGKRKCKYK